eukprot:6193408-Pleurochrysis_carterae.AAC.1
MATTALPPTSDVPPAGNEQADAPRCGGCKEIMVDVDTGLPRDPKRIAHSCDFCHQYLHSSVMCEH